MIGRFLAPVLVGVGACVAACAVLSGTLWRGADQVTATATASTAVLATAPGVLEALADSVDVRITAPAGGAVVAAIGRDTDVAAWIGSTPVTWLTGFTSPTQFATSSQPPAAVGVPSADDDAPLGIAEGSDLWISAEVVEGEGLVAWQRVPGRWSLLIAPAGTDLAAVADASAAGTAVSMTWPQTVSTPFVVPGLVTGFLTAAAGVVLWLVRRGQGVAEAKAPPVAATTLDDDESSGPRRASVAEAPSERAEPEVVSAMADTLVMSAEAILAAVEAGSAAGLTRRQIREAEKLAAASATSHGEPPRTRAPAGTTDKPARTSSDPARTSSDPARTSSQEVRPDSLAAIGDALEHPAQPAGAHGAGALGPGDWATPPEARSGPPAPSTAPADGAVSVASPRSPAYLVAFPDVPTAGLPPTPAPAAPLAAPLTSTAPLPPTPAPADRPPAAGAPSAPDPPARAALPAGASGPGVVDTPRRRPQLRAGWAAQPGLTPGSWSAHAASPADATGPPHDAIARARGFLASLNEREAPHHGDRLAVPDHPMSLGPGGRRHESDRDSGQLPVPDHPMSFPSRPLPGPGGSSPSHQHSAPPWPQPPAPLAGRHSFAPAWPASKAPGTPVDADTATDADTAAGTDTGTEAQP